MSVYISKLIFVNMYFEGKKNNLQSLEFGRFEGLESKLLEIER